MLQWLISLVAIVVIVASSRAADWPAWRGPTGQGFIAEANPPLKWDENTNIRWKTPLPGTGNASPIVWGNKIFITQATDKGKKRGVICIDRETGKKLWAQYIEFTGKEPTHDTNPYCSATCVTDGERVIASLGSAGLICFDFAGKELWRKDLGEFIHIWGTASSPIIHGDKVILWCGPGERQFLVAFNKVNGEQLWKHEEPGGKSGLKGNTEWIGSWSTPVIAKIGDEEQLILSVPLKVKGFNPKTGEELWSCEGLSNLIYTSPVVSKSGIVMAMSGYGGPALAVQAGEKGDITKKHRLWHHDKGNPQRIGSAVMIGDLAYHVNEQGIGSCFELKTGKDLWDKKRVTTATWGSLVHVGDRLYITSMDGETVVLKADPKFEIIARNKIPDRVLASPATVGDDIIIRGYKYLWCIGVTSK